MHTYIKENIIKLHLFFIFIGIIYFSASAQAGNYHVDETLICSACHTMHFSITHESHDVNGINDYLGPDGPYEYLLKDEVNNLCLMCHNGEHLTGPDVLEDDYSYEVRQAGGLNNTTSTSPYAQENGHTLGSTGSAPGGIFSNPDGLNCVDCHNPHGIEEQYRNLWTNDEPSDKFYNKSVTFANEVNDITKDVFQREVSYGGYCGGCHPIHGAEGYSEEDIDFNEPDNTKSNYANWCKSCHELFHGNKGGPEMGGGEGTEWLRHPTADADIGAIGGGHSSKDVFADKINKVKVMTSTENWDPTTPGEVTDHTPSCFTCHKAHGNQNPFGLIYMSGEGSITEEGDTEGDEPSDLCRQCHVQGG